MYNFFLLLANGPAPRQSLLAVSMSGGRAHELHADPELPAVPGVVSGQPGVQAEPVFAKHFKSPKNGKKKIICREQYAHF